MEKEFTRKEKNIKIKRYSRYLENYGRCTDLLSEAVIHIDNYLNILKDLFRQNKKSLIEFDELDNKIKKLNLIFKSYKIEFKLKDESGNNYGIVQGLFRKEYIYVYVGYNFEISLENEVSYEAMLKNLFPLLGHELVHRGQWYKSKNDFLNFYAFENEEEIKKMDLTNKWEIMAYALMTIESFRYAGYSDKKILDTFQLGLKKGGNFPFFVSRVMNLYINEIKESNFKVYKRFLKYIYDYLKNPIVNDLKVQI